MSSLFANKNPSMRWTVMAFSIVCGWNANGLFSALSIAINSCMSESICIITNFQILQIDASAISVDIDGQEYFLSIDKNISRKVQHRISLPEHYFIVHFTASSVKRTSVKTGLVRNDWFNSRTTTLSYTTKRSRVPAALSTRARYGCRGWLHIGYSCRWMERDLNLRDR